jgi:hypothetical protein
MLMLALALVLMLHRRPADTRAAWLPPDAVATLSSPQLDAMETGLAPGRAPRARIRPQIQRSSRQGPIERVHGPDHGVASGGPAAMVLM